MTGLRLLALVAIFALTAGCEDGELKLPFVDAPELEQNTRALREAYRHKVEWCEVNRGAEAEDGMAAEFCEMAEVDIQIHTDAAYKLNFPQTYILASIEVAAAQGAVDFYCSDTAQQIAGGCDARQTELVNARTRLKKTRSYGN